eukprot:CAMPEP_0173186794 /NCGR_PEP_ID=MMETSP1141-20130122/10338_1 /TAXON_ID=483371 /ORGANISM="non described non described, Strain CCMP2298" /LENGTH=30 /DNA_ID= /DNA_START= /DNA_END= /DNA_ORIENTATION=
MSTPVAPMSPVSLQYPQGPSAVQQMPPRVL